ncbi:MAG: hypothetical protein Q8N15_00600 [Bacillota bacterium]|nr:hypothetical protein [Bacillota bacterium]
MSRHYLEQEQNRVLRLVLKGDITYEQAETILTAIILDKMQTGQITPNEASDMLRRIQ